MANHMKEVTKILGVELGKRFIVNVQDNKYLDAMINEDGMCVLNGPEVWKKHNATVCLHKLLKGELSIKRTPWKPSFNEKYYSIGPGGVLEPGTWLNDFIDRALYKLGNCYQTAQEAEADQDKWVKFYTSNEVLDV